MKNEWNQEYEKEIKNRLEQSIENTFSSEYVKNKIDLKISKIENQKGEFKMKNKKIAILTVAVCLLSVGVVFAAGKLTGIGSISSSTPAYNYTTYNDVEKAKKKVGFEAIVPKELKAGYKFDGIHIVNISDVDEENNKFNNRKSIAVTYKNNNNESISLRIDKVPENSFKLDEEPNQDIRTIKGIKYYYSLLENLSLASEDDMTAEEKEKSENDPFFNVAIAGKGTVRETHISKHLSFEYNGVRYMLMSGEKMDKELLYKIGTEIVNEK